jgi:hypothetical protein
MSEENCSDSDVSVSCRYSSRVKKYVCITNSGVSNFIPEKSKRGASLTWKWKYLLHGNIKMTFTLTALVESKGCEIGFRGLF